MAVKKKEEIKPWDRQPGEGTQAFKAFTAYRDSGINGARRSLQKTAASLIKRDGTPYSTGTLTEWSGKYNWQARVNAFDDDLDRLSQEEIRRGVVAMAKEHISMAKEVRDTAMEALRILPRQEMSASDIVKMLDFSVKTERLSRGDVTERTEAKQTVGGKVQLAAEVGVRPDLKNLSDEELIQLEGIINKLSAEQ